MNLFSKSKYSTLVIALLTAYSWRLPVSIAKKVEIPEEWTFLVLADWHGAEKFVMAGKNYVEETYEDGEVDRNYELDYSDLDGRNIQSDIDTLKKIKETFGGDLILFPGDTQGGHWDDAKFIKKFDKSLTPAQSIEQAGKFCYDGLRDVFEAGGYSELLVTVGDHELGGNAWNANSLHLSMVPEFRKAFTLGFNTEDDGLLRYRTAVGKKKVQPRPWGTPFQYTSFATVHNNVAFISVDAFHQFSDENYFHPELGTGGEGAITCTVTGKHLIWFRKVLESVSEDKDIDYIIVSAHDPVLQPVRRMNSSGQFMDFAEDSEFWKTMREFKVDVYFAGEVHDNTAAKDPDPNSNLIQVVSRGNGFNNFLKVIVKEESLEIINFNEVGELPKYNGEYVEAGKITISKPDKGETVVTGEGTLSFIDKSKPIIYFSFERTTPMENRPVHGLRHAEEKDRLVGRYMDIRGTNSTKSIPNEGEFGQQYDAQAGLLSLTSNGMIGRSGLFRYKTRVGVWGMGPHSGGIAMSYATWVKTNNCKAMVLISYANVYANEQEDSNHQMTLLINDGHPQLMLNSDTVLSAAKMPKLCKTKSWNHIIISMPRNSCLLSEVQMYVNGREVETEITKGQDEYIFISTRGRIALGGFGHAGDIYDDLSLFPFKPFMGQMDEVYVYAKPLDEETIDKMLVGKQFKAQGGRRECRDNGEVIAENTMSKWNCQNACAKNPKCWGFESVVTGPGAFTCKLYDRRPIASNKWNSKAYCFTSK